MKKRVRRVIFYLSVLLFLVLSLLVAFFAMGYKYDFVENKLLKTGSFEVKTNIDAQVYVNDELAGTTSFLSDSFSKSRLLPRTYTVRVQNDEYQPWQKLVDIEAGIFTNFPQVILIHRSPVEETVATSSLSGISSIKFDADKKTAEVSNKRQMEVISLDTGQKTSPQPLTKPAASTTAKSEVNLIKSPDGNKNAWVDDRELWVEWLKDTDYQPIKKAGDSELITRFSQEISDVQWYKDSAHLIANVGGVLKFIEIDTRGGSNIFDISTVAGPFYYDKDLDAIFEFSGKNLVKIGLK